MKKVRIKKIIVGYASLTEPTFCVVSIMVLPFFFGLNGIWSAIVVAEVLSLAVSVGFLIGTRKKYEYL